MANPFLDKAESSTVEGYRAYRINEAVGHASLFVEFKSGCIYRYIVPWDIYLEMKKSSSLGQFVNKMKVVYKGTLISVDELTSLVDSVSNKAANTRKKKMPGAAFFKKYPQFGYFF
jgi:hypothetical protein